MLSTYSAVLSRSAAPLGAATARIAQRFMSATNAAAAAEVPQPQSMLRMDPKEFVNHMESVGQNRLYAVYDPEHKAVKVSHSAFSELAEFFANDKVDYRGHEGIFLEVGKRTKMLCGAFIWRTDRGQACGGIRLWQYNEMETYLRDGLRLALGMGVKSALAGLWHGGGKGVIPRSPSDRRAVEDAAFRTAMFEDYGEFLSSLNGAYVCAEDVGLNVEDLRVVYSKSRYSTCIPEALGGSGNPSPYTAKGVVCAMEGALDHLGLGDISGKTIAMMGCGNVGSPMIGELLQRGAKKVIASDVQETSINAAANVFADAIKAGRVELRKVEIGDLSILSEPCDILAPNALGNVLTPATIPNINAKIVCGAANSQLANVEDDAMLKARGIVYVPDFVANRMGIVNCANEQYGRLEHDPAIERHFGRDWENSCFNITKTILRRAETEGSTPGKAALKLADEYSLQAHPIWPDRSRMIIRSLVESNWATARL